MRTELVGYTVVASPKNAVAVAQLFLALRAVAIRRMIFTVPMSRTRAVFVCNLTSMVLSQAQL